MGLRISGLFDHAGRSIRSRLLAGVAVIVPVLVTSWIILFVFNFLDGWLRPIVESLIGRHIPGVGLLATVLLVYLMGLIVSNIVGKSVVGWTERLLLRLPLIRDVYGSSKQILEAVSSPSSFGFKRVVVFDFPRIGVRVLGFVTRELVSAEGTLLYTVFMPTSPNPTSGYLLMIPASEVDDAGMAVEDAVKMIVSGGMVIPQGYRPRIEGGAAAAQRATVAREEQAVRQEPAESERG